jgi:sec-independent protein translocase protein TatB
VFGISANEFIVLLAVAAIVLGPERLPQYTQQLARLVRELRRMAQGASEQVRSELGPEFDDVDWRKLDPRQYDPRRIVREALSDSFDLDDPLGLRDKPVSSGGPADVSASGMPDSANGVNGANGGPPSQRPRPGSVGPAPAEATPFDPDAT